MGNTGKLMRATAGHNVQTVLDLITFSIVEVDGWPLVSMTLTILVSEFPTMLRLLGNLPTHKLICLDLIISS